MYQPGPIVGLLLAVSSLPTAAVEPAQSECARRLGVPVEMANSLGLPLVLIPSGEFLMRSSPAEVERLVADTTQPQRRQLYRSEGPQHRVRISRPFYLGQTSVTVGQFQAFVAAAGYRTEAERDGRGGFGLVGHAWVQDPKFTWQRDPGWTQTSRHPVVNVSWQDAVAFCAWLTQQEGKAYRLPTEAEWEYACRAGTATRWHCGDDPRELDGCAWLRSNSDWRAHPVGEKKLNRFGLADMHGNVRNWCSDWYRSDGYTSGLHIDPTGPESGTYRLVRGSAFHYSPDFARAATRFHDRPAHRHGQIGFRVVRVIE